MDGGTGFHDVDDLAPQADLTRARWDADMAQVIGAVRFGLERRRDETLALLCAIIEAQAAVAPGMGAVFDTLRENAVDWAETSSPMEVEAVTAAGLKQIGKKAFAISARKRLLVMLWNSLEPADRAAFLAKMGAP